jgi:hypothetical protein
VFLKFIKEVTVYIASALRVYKVVFLGSSFMPLPLNIKEVLIFIA